MLKLLAETYEQQCKFQQALHRVVGYVKSFWTSIARQLLLKSRTAIYFCNGAQITAVLKRVLACYTTFVRQGPVVRSLVSASRWLRGIKTYRFPWCLTLVSANHASSNPGLVSICLSTLSTLHCTSQSETGSTRRP